MQSVRATFIFAAFASILLPATTAVSAETPLRVGADRPIDVLHIRLELNVDLEAKEVSGTAAVQFAALRNLTSLRLDAVDFRTTQVTLSRDDGPARPVDFRDDGKQIVITPDRAFSAGQRGTVTVTYSVHEPDAGLYFRAPTSAEPDTPFQMWSQGEMHEARYWIPCLDQPNERQTTEIIATVKSGLEVLSNGALVSRTENLDAGTTTFHWKQERDHVIYLVTLVVGKFAVERETWRGKPVTYYVPPDRRDDIERSFGDTTRMLDLFSDRIGVEYPWEKYAQVVVEQFTWGGMENTSATTLTESTLHDAKAHVDFSSEGLVAHELAHQWFGDLLTCRDWAHVWLNEGFATYLEAIWSEFDDGPDAFALNMLGKARAAIDGGKDRPIVDRRWRRPHDQFGARAYPKGAWVLHMIRGRVGDELFWKIITTYTKRHAYGIVETVDFRKVCEEVTGRSFERFFHDWTERAGHPVVDVDMSWVAEDKLAKVVVEQTQASEPFHFPVVLEFVLEDREEPVHVRHEMTEKQQTFYVPLPSQPIRFRFDPGHTVLKEETITQGRDLWIEQLGTDPDPIGRIFAARHLGESGSDADVEALIEALENEAFWGVQDAICKALGKAGGDEARDALIHALTLDSPKVRTQVAGQLGDFRDEPTVLAALKLIVENGADSYALEAAAIRSYAKHRPDGLRATLEPLLARTSHREGVRSAVLRALGDSLDAGTVDVLLEWAQPGKPRPCRSAAMQALSRLARTVELSDAILHAIVERLTKSLDRDENHRVRRVAIGALRDLGKAAYPAESALEAIVHHEEYERSRDLAREALKRIRAGMPAQVELSDLRKQVESLEETNKDLEDRIEVLEGKGAK